MSLIGSVNLCCCSPPSYGTGGDFLSRGDRVDSEPRVHLFIDYQNVHLSVLEAFAPPGTPAQKVLIHPGAFGDQVMAERAARRRRGVLTEIHVYRGRPSPTRDPTLTSITDAQAAHWTRDPRVKMHRRPLRYPSDWPRQRAREKGVDVMLACDFVRHALERRRWCAHPRVERHRPRPCVRDGPRHRQCRSRGGDVEQLLSPASSGVPALVYLPRWSPLRGIQRRTPVLTQTTSDRPA